MLYKKFVIGVKHGWARKETIETNISKALNEDLSNALWNAKIMSNEEEDAYLTEKYGSEIMSEVSKFRSSPIANPHQYAQDNNQNSFGGYLA